MVSFEFLHIADMIVQNEARMLVGDLVIKITALNCGFIGCPM